MSSDSTTTSTPAVVKSEIGDEVPFAELARHERKAPRRRGRPPKATRRRHVTVHLTGAEIEELGALHTALARYFSASRSELIGVAVSLLAGAVEQARTTGQLTSFDLEGFRAWALAQVEFMDLRNQKITRMRKSGEE